MQVLTLVSGLPVYLPYDYAHVPFGDPFNDVTITSSIVGQQVSVQGYQATSNDLVMFSVNSGSTIAANVTANYVYYVTSAATNGANGTFYISLTKGGSVIASATGQNATSGQVVLHLISNQIDGTVLPFKAGASVVALNTTANPVWLLSAADTYGGTPGVVAALGSSPPGGPATFAVVASVAAGAAAVLSLNNDWVKSSNGNLILLQN
jgi:hypothetical protein